MLPGFCRDELGPEPLRPLRSASRLAGGKTWSPSRSDAQSGLSGSARACPSHALPFPQGKSPETRSAGRFITCHDSGVICGSVWPFFRSRPLGGAARLAPGGTRGRPGNHARAVLASRARGPNSCPSLQDAFRGGRQSRQLAGCLPGALRPTPGARAGVSEILPSIGRYPGRLPRRGVLVTCRRV